MLKHERKLPAFYISYEDINIINHIIASRLYILHFRNLYTQARALYLALGYFNITLSWT